MPTLNPNWVTTQISINPSSSTITLGGGGGGVLYNRTTDTDLPGRLNLKGPDADIIIDGESLKETLQAVTETLGTVAERLNILTPNAELEAEWDQLRELGDQYRRLEADIRDKQEMWDRLRKK